ncbi:citrate-proton symporter, partial [Enterobacter hormaechei]|nr:citrate-proton symporter [Enterobacter hormaechei]
IRRSLQETEEFLNKPHRPTIAEITKSMLQNWNIVLAGMGMVIMTTVSFYMITAYTPTFGKEVLHLSAVDALIV